MRITLSALSLLLLACGEKPVAVTEAPQRGPVTKTTPVADPELPAEARLVERADGVRIDVLEGGRGEQLSVGDRVRAHVIARVAESEEPFLSTRASGRPLTYSIDIASPDTPIEGLRRALTELRVGSRAEIHVPSELAYGAKGLPSAGIPEDADLVFEIRIKSRIQP